MTELKPCPFCGGEASIYHGDSDRYLKGTDFVLAFCGWCGASIRGKKEDEVIKKWNTRPNPWHTGTPTEGEDYLVQYKNSEHDVLHFANLSWFAFNRGGVEWQKIPDSSIVAWQKIEPYKENEDGRTD